MANVLLAIVGAGLLLLIGCAGQQVPITADSFQIEGSLRCEGSGTITAFNAITVGIEGGAGLAGSLEEELGGACEEVAVTFGAARWVLFSESQGSAACAERAGEVVFVPPAKKEK